jgi:hypothetical protein
LNAHAPSSVDRDFSRPGGCSPGRRPGLQVRRFRPRPGALPGRRPVPAGRPERPADHRGDVCPGTLQALAAASDQLGPKAKDLKIVFISVDPDRDNPQQVKAFLSGGNLPKNILGLTGTPQQVATAAKAYRVYYKQVGDGPGYSVDHSTAIYLMDPKGRFATVIPYNVPPEEIARQIKDAMAGR